MPELATHQEQQIREAAKREVQRFSLLLADEIADVPMRDGRMLVRDLWEAVANASRRHNNDELA